MDLTLLHPIINHFTIALISISILLDILGAITKNQRYHFAAWMNLLFGGIAGIFTVVSGEIAESKVAHSKSAHELMETHETIGYIILALVVFLFIWRIFLKSEFPQKAAGLYLTLGIIAAGLIFINGFYGGELVFRHGVAVEVSLPQEESGHSHNDEHSDSPKTKQLVPQDTMKEDVHIHEDGSEHQH